MGMTKLLVHDVHIPIPSTVLMVMLAIMVALLLLLLLLVGIISEGHDNPTPQELWMYSSPSWSEGEE